MAYRVKAVAAVAKVGGSQRYLYRGAIVPAAATNIDHLLEVGLIEEVSLLDETLEAAAPVPIADGPEDDALALASTEGDEGESAGPPAKAGPGSSAEEWRNYAAALGVAVPEDARRDDVIAALEAAGKPTE